LNAEKFVGVHVKKSVTSSFFNRFTFYLAIKLKFQTVAEKTAKNFRGPLFAAPYILCII